MIILPFGIVSIPLYIQLLCSDMASFYNDIRKCTGSLACVISVQALGQALPLPLFQNYFTLFFTIWKQLNASQ